MTSPVKRERRERALALYKSEGFWDDLFETIGRGGSLSTYIAARDIPYGTTYMMIRADDQLAARYDAARKARALVHSEGIEAISDKVERGEMDPKAGAVVIGAKQWLASRMDPKHFSETVTQNVNLTDKTKLHLDALRAMNAKRLAKIAERERLTATDAELVLDPAPHLEALSAPGIVIEGEAVTIPNRPNPSSV